ncbi:MAG: endonuclease/exonuclease/phosphatase family protein [Deltaproteobacteria bacterium]|uniref:Endonuclease/exonuclease/phosphatase family protein n=1 Tax=Candidatus Zymogenus saltonus TaxID=2844893 RepID=A0A9D8KJ15_9DELT|nr:endonuclease/exonuclease/phosphatase family protein [Candidatus Zymogenus saltonus]
MKKTISIFIAMLIILAVSTAAQAKDVKLVDYNVWFGLDGNGTFKIGEYEDKATRCKRFDLLVSGLMKLNPDVIGIQEANELPGYARRLARKIGYSAVWKVGNSGLKLFGFGIPVNFTEGDAVLAMSNHNLEFLGARRLSGKGIQRDYLSVHTKEVRNVMATKVVIDGRPLIVFNTHTHFSLIMDETWTNKLEDMVIEGNITREEKDAILAEMEESHERTESDVMNLTAFVKEITKKYDYPYVIMGDFNTTKNSPAIQKMIADLGLLDPYELMNPGADGFTWDSVKNPNTAFDGSQRWADGKTLKDPLSRLEAQFDLETPRRIDFIFLSSHFRPEDIKSSRLIFNEPVDGVFVSDHFGVEVILEGIPK